MYGWRTTVTLKPVVVVAMVASLCGLPGADPRASAGDAQRGYVVDYVPPSLLAQSATTPTRSKPVDEMLPPDERILGIPPLRPQTSGERWLEFEREYGIQQQNRSWAVGMLQSAKYGLDKMAFTAKETANQLEFTYDVGSPTGPGGVTPKPQFLLPLFGAFGRPQLKSVLTEHDPQTGTPFIGLKLGIPFGEGD